MDEAFLDELKRGNSAAYAELVERFEASLYRFFFFQHRNHHLAEEQTAETFVALVRSLPTMRGGPQQLRPFVFATARHIQLRQYRRRTLGSGELGEAEHLADRAPLPDAIAAGREQLQLVLAVIGELEDPARSVMLLRFVEELSLEEIGAALALPLGTVKSHLHRSRARLKVLFANQEFDHER